MSISVFKTTQRIIMGTGSLKRLSEEIVALKAKRPIVITDEGIRKSGILQRLEDLLKVSTEILSVFSSVPPEPPMDIIEEIVNQARQDQIDSVIGIGGGSSMDTAKVLSVLMSNNQSLDSMVGVNLVKHRGIPLVLIPTTAGTGSEVTPIAIFTDTREDLKKGVVSDYLFPAAAILDPELTLTLPASVTAASGIDALIHAIEAYTSLNATAYTDHLAVRAIRLITENLRTAWARGSDINARMAMLEGSMLAGQAFANAGVTAVHAFAYPLGGKFHIPHGVSNAVMFCPVMRFNMIANLQKFASIADILLPDLKINHCKTRIEAWINEVEDMIKDLQLPLSLKELKVPEEAIDELSESVLKVTRLLANNPRGLTFKDAQRIYREAYEGI